MSARTGDGGSGDPLSGVAGAIARESTYQTQLLRQLVNGQGDVNIAVGDNDQLGVTIEDFPAGGAKRVTVYRPGSGYDGLAVPASGAAASAVVLGGNSARLGGTIINSGAVPVILYLTDRPVPAAAVPAIYLAANGGSWDMRLSNIVWCGHVSAVGVGGASTLTVAVV